MWGLVHPGIRQFKAGFGGREIAYIGGWELPLDPLGALAYRVGAAATDRLDGAPQPAAPGAHGRRRHGSAPARTEP